MLATDIKINNQEAHECEACQLLHYWTQFIKDWNHNELTDIN
jgi:hypothetical protein